MKLTRESRPAAFSLIELLVVIAGYRDGTFSFLDDVLQRGRASGALPRRRYARTNPSGISREEAKVAKAEGIPDGIHRIKILRPVPPVNPVRPCFIFLRRLRFFAGQLHFAKT